MVDRERLRIMLFKVTSVERGVGEPAKQWSTRWKQIEERHQRRRKMPGALLRPAIGILKSRARDANPRVREHKVDESFERPLAKPGIRIEQQHKIRPIYQGLQPLIGSRGKSTILHIGD